MQSKLDASQEFQVLAVEAVTDLFRGQARAAGRPGGSSIAVLVPVIVLGIELTGHSDVRREVERTMDPGCATKPRS